jgi:hypothetical protein
VSPTPRSPAMHEPRERNHALLRFCAATMMQPDHFCTLVSFAFARSRLPDELDAPCKLSFRCP